MVKAKYFYKIEGELPVSSLCHFGVDILQSSRDKSLAMLLFFLFYCFFAAPITLIFIKPLPQLTFVFTILFRQSSTIPPFHIYFLCDTNLFCCACFSLRVLILQPYPQDSPHFLVMYFFCRAFFHTTENNQPLVLLLTYKDFNHFLLFISFLLVVGPHSTRPILCAFMQMSVMKGNTWEHQRGNTALLPQPWQIVSSKNKCQKAN